MKQLVSLKDDSNRYAANPEKYCEKQRRYYLRNSEKEKARARLYRSNNPDKVKKQQKAYLVNNLDKIRESNKNYRKSNPDKALQFSRTQYAKIKESKVLKERINKRVKERYHSEERIRLLSKNRSRTRYLNLPVEKRKKYQSNMKKTRINDLPDYYILSLMKCKKDDNDGISKELIEARRTIVKIRRFCKAG